MATFTPNLNLKKPDGSDYVRVGDFNDNSNVLDGIVGNPSELLTPTKNNLVQAINQAAQSGGNAPYIGENNNWFVWDTATLQYIDTGIPATGIAATIEAGTATSTAYGNEPEVVNVGTESAARFDFVIPEGKQGPKGDTGTGLDIRGTYATLAALEAAVPSPEAGWMYNIGTGAPFNIYMWDGIQGEWSDQGQLQGEPGEPGPNAITDTTTTNLTGILMGNGSGVTTAIEGEDFAIPPRRLTPTLTTDGWTQDGDIYTKTLSIPGLNQAENINHLVGPASTRAATLAYGAAVIIPMDVTVAGEMTFTAAQPPTEDIDLVISQEVVIIG